MNRKEFLKNLGITGPAIFALYCMGGGMTSCVNETKTVPAPSPNPANPNPTPNPPTSSKIDFTIDLKDFPKLQSVNGFDYRDSIIIVRTQSDKFVALSKSCTHQGTTVTFQSNNNQIFCENHGSAFALDGTVKIGPAAASLKLYSTEFDSTTGKLRIFET